MKTLSMSEQEKLKALVHKQSKHSDYQALHPWISSIVPKDDYRPSGKVESQRQNYMNTRYDFSRKKILDIGANTGYFSFGALQAGAAHVVAYEGNPEHAEFIAEAGKIIDLQDKLSVRSTYFDFSALTSEIFDAGLCLNVLHHLGDDFGDPSLNVDEAKREITAAIQALNQSCDTLWFQIGFNWRGDKTTPLFNTGTKQELINFVENACKNSWNIENIGIFNPETSLYEPSTPALLQRFDVLGEFLNRPIFLMKKHRVY